jgi:hypothetical protein
MVWRRMESSYPMQQSVVCHRWAGVVFCPSLQFEKLCVVSSKHLKHMYNFLHLSTLSSSPMARNSSQSDTSCSLEHIWQPDEFLSSDLGQSCSCTLPSFANASGCLEANGPIASPLLFASGDLALSVVGFAIVALVCCTLATSITNFLKF